MKGKIRKAGRRGILALAILLLACPAEVSAGIKESDVFLDANWTYAGETSVFTATGWLQAVCATEDYIICLENYDNSKTDPDTLIAFYKNPYDEYGNPVEQYSYAKHVTEMDYEHGNGMTYDPGRNEIVIAGGRAIRRSNTGCIFVVDGDSLEFKRKVKVTDEGRVNAIDYWEEEDQFIMLIGNSKNEFKFIVTDREFNVLETLMEADISAGNAFQDFCISGDYIISIPFMKRTGKEDVLQVYSISERRLVGTYSLQMEDEDTYVEPESICEIEPGVLLIGSALKDPSRIAFYTTRVEAAFSVRTIVEHGTVTSSQKVLDQGTDFTVRYTPDEDYELSSVTVDGRELDIREYPNEYVFSNLQEDHEIIIDFTEIPLYDITASAENGTIDSLVQVRRGKDATVRFQPQEHYELARLLIDGVEAEAERDATEYTFRDVQEPHTLQAVFEEIPSYSVETRVKNGTISPTVEKIYRDDSCTVTYQGKEGYEVAHILVDGAELENVTAAEQGRYVFEDVQEAHTITVIYQWSYLPLVILVVFWAAAWIVAVQALKLERKRRKWKK